MAREYRHIKQYEKEIMEMKAQGLTYREVGERLGFERKQIREFIHRKNRNERKSAAGIITRLKEGRAKMVRIYLRPYNN